MIRSELVGRLAERNKDLLVSDIERVVETFFTTIRAALVDNDRLEIRGFGAFTTRERQARVGRNPRTGVAVTVKSKRVPHFRCGKSLGLRINKA